MTQYIVLTKAEADAIRGKPTPFAAVDPVPLKDGTFLIGDEVLADPVHAALVAKVSGIKSKPRVDKAVIDPLLPTATLSVSNAPVDEAQP